MAGATAVEEAPRLVGEAEFLAAWRGTPESLARAVADGVVFVVVRDGRRLYPNFFAYRTLEHRHLAAVSKLLVHVGDHAKWLFFVSPKASLSGLTPLEALREGRLRQVKVTARGFAER